MNSNTDNIANRVFWLLAGITGLVLLWDSADYRLVTYSIFADYWEHTATFKAWLGNIAEPGNPHVAENSSSARYMPLWLLLVVICGPLGLDPIDIMGVAAVINFALLTIGIRLFFNAYFRNPWAAPVAFVVLLSFWGVPWIWSNLYELRSLFMTVSYPSTFVFALALISLWVTLRFLDGRIAYFTGLLVLLVLSALMFVTHPLTGAFGISACGLLALTERGAPLSLKVQVCVIMLGGTLLAELWPWFSVWEITLARTDEVDDRSWHVFTGIDGMLERARSGIWIHLFYLPVETLTVLGPALLGLPIAAYLLLRGRLLLIPLGMGLMLAPYFLNIFMQIALAHRFLLYAVFFMHMAIVWAILSLFNRWREARELGTSAPGINLAVGITRVLTVLLALGHIALLWGDYQGAHLNQRLELIEKRKALPAGYDAPRLYNELTAGLPDDAIVLGNRQLTWPLPTFKGKVVALPENHENSLMLNPTERVRDVELFLADDTDSMTRRAVAEKYNATYVMIDPRNTAPGLMAWLNDNASLENTAGWYQMLAINSPRQ